MTFNRGRGLAVLAFSVVAGAAVAFPFEVTFTNFGPQPLSPIFFAASNGSFDIFDAGSAAPSSIEMIAEDGDNSGLLADAGAAGADVLSFGSAGAGPIMPGDSVTFIVNADMDHRWFQFASMLGMTNDGWIGSGVGFGDFQIDLFQGGEALNADFTISFLNVWDAGTEVNTELEDHLPGFGNIGVGPAEGGVIHGPHGGILGVGDLPLSLDWYGQDVAHVTITAVPEPATMAVLGIGALALLRRRKKG